VGEREGGAGHRWSNRPASPKSDAGYVLVLATLDFAGDDSTGNFVLGSDHHGGTDIGFVAEARVLGGWHTADAGAFD
jgi:hypothetical protein